MCEKNLMDKWWRNKYNVYWRKDKNSRTKYHLSDKPFRLNWLPVRGAWGNDFSLVLCDVTKLRIKFHTKMSLHRDSFTLFKPMPGKLFAVNKKETRKCTRANAPENSFPLFSTKFSDSNFICIVQVSRDSRVCIQCIRNSFGFVSLTPFVFYLFALFSISYDRWTIMFWFQLHFLLLGFLPVGPLKFPFSLYREDNLV